MILEKSIVTRSRTEIIDVTDQIEKHVTEIREGSVTLFTPHTTCGVTINENADPDVKKDISAWMKKVIPQNDNYLHREGNSDAHIKAILTGSTLHLIIQNGKLLLGIWQGIYFCEFDGPRNRKFFLQIQEIQN